MAEKVTLDQVRERLIEAARDGDVVVYSDLYGGDKGQAHGRSSSDLGKIGEAEHKQGRPLLSVIAVAKDTREPKHGLIDLADSHDRWCGCDSPPRLPGEDLAGLRFRIRCVRTVNECRPGSNRPSSWCAS